MYERTRYHMWLLPNAGVGARFSAVLIGVCAALVFLGADARSYGQITDCNNNGISDDVDLANCDQYHDDYPGCRDCNGKESNSPPRRG